MVWGSLKDWVSLLPRFVKKIFAHDEGVFASGQLPAAADMPSLSHAHMSDENGFPISADHEILLNPKEVVKNLLERDGKVVVGKLKSSFSDMEFLIEHMQYLAKLGVRKLFCNFISAADQNLLDRYHRDEIPGENVEEYLNRKFSNYQSGVALSTRTELYLRLLRTAREAGITSMGIDTDSGTIGAPDPSEAAKIINRYDKKIAGKSIICIGAMEWAEI